MLPCWKGKFSILSIKKGNTTQHIIVKDQRNKFLVRVGGNNKLRKIKRSDEILITKTASHLNITPEVIYSEKNLMVQKYINAKEFTITKQDYLNHTLTL